MLDKPEVYVLLLCGVAGISLPGVRGLLWSNPEPMVQETLPSVPAHPPAQNTWLQLGQPQHGHWTQPVSSTQADAPEKMQALGGKQPSDSVPDSVAHVSRHRPRPLVQAQTHPHAAFRDATRRWGLDTQVVLLVPPVPVHRATVRAPGSPGG